MSFLDQVTGLLPLANVNPLPPEARNVVLIPPGPPPDVRSGTLLHDDAGPPGGGGPPQRVIAVLGPGATFAGLADTLAPLYAKAAGGGGPAAPAPGDLARAILAYAQDYLHADDWQFHTVGVLLPLPIEIDPVSHVWIVDADRIRALAKPGSLPKSFKDKWRPRLASPPRAVAVPDALDVEDDAHTLTTRGTPPAMLVQQRWTEVMRNPSQEALRFLAVLRALDGKGAGPGAPGQAAAAALPAVTGTTPEQLSVLAATTAGNGLLRYLATLLSVPPAGADPALVGQIVARLNDALRPGGKPVDHHDVPETPAQLAPRLNKDSRAVEGAAADPPGGVHRLVLGYDVAVGSFGSERVNGVLYTGPSFAGRVAMHPYLAADTARLNSGAGPDMPSLLVLLDGRPIADHQVGERPTGWRLDGVKARGPGLLTAGLDRWDATDAAGLPALLSAYKNVAPDEFDLFFAVHNLDVQPGPAGGPAFQLMIVGADGVPTVPDAATLQAFFGGTTGANGVTFSSDWAARFRLPALVSVTYRRAQVAQATAKLARSADPLAMKVASVLPFPAAKYTLPLDTTAGDALARLLTPALHTVTLQALGLGARDADTLAVALVDLSGATPAYAGFNDDDTYYAASLAKIMPMYAAYELRSRVQQVVSKAKAAGLDPVARWLPMLKIIGDVWGPQVCRVSPDFPQLPGFPKLDVHYPERFPDLKHMFTIAPDGTVSFLKALPTDDPRRVPTDDDIAASIGEPTSRMRFYHWMKGMVLWSNDDAAGLVINTIQYPYINGLLSAAGFFDPKANPPLGLWISGNYAHQDWKQGKDLMTLTDRGQRHYKKDTNHVGTARQTARLLAMAAGGQLFEGDAATRANVGNDMIELMRKQWVISTGPPVVRGGAPVSGGPGADTFFGNAIASDLQPGDTISSKIGVGNPQPVTGLVGIHDCVIVRRTIGGRTFRYVAVVLGGYQDEVDAGVWNNAADVADRVIHP